MSARPSFSSQVTSDRLREGMREGTRDDTREGISTSPIPPSPTTKIKLLRRSVFKEVGLDDENSSNESKKLMPEDKVTRGEERNVPNVTFDSILKDSENKEEAEGLKKRHWFSKPANGRRTIQTSASAPPGLLPTLPRTALIVILIALVVPGIRYNGGAGQGEGSVVGVDASVMDAARLVNNGNAIEGRQLSPTAVCTRWSMQAANVNGTLYVYGGQATTESGQTANAWNNDFFTLDLTKTWEISSPSLSGLPQPSGPPAVAEGYLWHSYDTLWLYGGEFSDSPSTSPLPVSTWEYSIKSSAWTEYPNPQTSAGNNSDGGGLSVQRAAEGAGLSVPELGLSWYFGGHLDLYTTYGWSNQIARVYLRSLLEFTHPGYTNTGVYSLSTTGAASGGVYRNITQGGLQADAGFTERADGVLVYVPGWGENGILLGLAGGTNESFTEMNVVDVYDIASSSWFKQATSGPSPPIRVDPCAVVAAAPDGSSFNIYLYGGQNLIPYGSQIQYSDMWILTIPSFTWIQVDMTGQSQPPARAGHVCTIFDSQIVVVGGYVGKNISCDSPGIYVFNASSLQWTNSFTSVSDSSSSGSAFDDQGSSILRGSYGYAVPAVVQSVIGGSSAGGATVTIPAAGSATAGPLATGKPPTFTVTQSGSTVIQTAHSTSTVTSSQPDDASKSKVSGGVISVSVVAGVLGLAVAYLAFCTWLYRRQLKLYRDHVAMGQRTAFTADKWNSSAEDESTGFGRANENFAGGGTMLSALSSGSVGRQSGERSISPGERAGGSQGNGVYGGGIFPGRGAYGRVSEEDESTEYRGTNRPGQNNWPRHSTHSSMEDLLGGQEPSFFTIVLNPKRVLRVIN